MSIMAIPFVLAVALITVCCLVFVKPEPLSVKEGDTKLPPARTVLYLLLFALFCSLFHDKPAIERLGLSTGGVITYIALATVLARVISSVYNCLINAKVVFKTRSNLAYSCVKYFSLVIVQMCASALLTTLGVALIPVFPEVVVKAMVDTVLFFCSFYIQRRFVF
jgi:putative flippase GtrA